MLQKNNSKKRIFYYDALRFLAIIFIIACHVFAGYVTKKSSFGTNFWLFSMFFNSLRDIGVPLFVAISGTLLLSRKDSLVKFVKKRLTRVLIPYIFWAAMFFLFVVVCMNFNLHYNKTPLSVLFFTIFNINPQPPGVYLWFVPMILVVYVFVFLINKINERYPAIFKISLILSILVIILFTFDIMPSKPYNYPFYTAFAVFGYYLANTDFTLKSLRIDETKLTIIFFILTIALFGLLTLINASMSITSKHFTHLSQFHILPVFTMISLFLFCRYFSESGGLIHRLYSIIKTSKIGEAISSISITSYGIYLVHMIVLVTIKIYTKSLEHGLGKAGYTMMLLIATLVISWIIVLLLSNVPYVNIISGAG